MPTGAPDALLPLRGAGAPGSVLGSEEPSGRGLRSASQCAKKQMERLQLGPCSQMQVRNLSGCSQYSNRLWVQGRGGGGGW